MGQPFINMESNKLESVKIEPAIILQDATNEIDQKERMIDNLYHNSKPKLKHVFTQGSITSEDYTKSLNNMYNKIQLYSNSIVRLKSTASIIDATI